MHKWLKMAAVAVVAGLAAAPASLQATDGYFSHAFGTKSSGMAGAGVAVPLGPMSPATNPALLARTTPGLDFGVGLFNPNRQYEVKGNPSGYPGTFGLAPGTVESGSSLFFMPHFGYSKAVGGSSVFGLALYGNGGMNTNYDAKTFGFAPTGVNMSQLFVAPTWAVKLGDHHAIGVTGILGYQMFKAEGLQAFGMFSSDAANLTNNDTDSSFGAGVRVGYHGQLSKYVSIGASYQSKMFMSEFDKYKGLFAEQGDFDVPSNWTVGIGLKPAEHVDVAIDVQQVRYSEVASVGNPLLPNLMQAPLGADGGAGFGWHDVTTIKAGLQYRAGGGWTWRAGYSYGEQPIPSSEVLFNIIAPGVIEQHATFGFSKESAGGKSFDVAVTRAFNKDVTGPNPLEVPNLQSITLSMDQWVFTVGYSVSFK